MTSDILWFFILQKCQLGSQLRFFASVNSGEKSGKNNRLVNKNVAKAKKLSQRTDEPALTIYPFSMEDLKKSESNTKTTNKTIQKTALTNKAEKATCNKSEIVTAANKTETATAANITETATAANKTEIVTVANKTEKSANSKTPEKVPILACKLPERNTQNKVPSGKTDTEKRIEALVI